MSLSVAVVGAGHRGLEHAEAVRRVDGMELVGVVGRPGSPATATSVADLPRPQALDVAVVATGPAVRAGVVAEVLRSTGVRAVVAEKPLALDLADAAEIASLCTSAGVRLFVGHHWRHTRNFQMIRDAVRSGCIGRVERFEGQAFGNLYHQGSHLIDACRWIAQAPVSWVMSSAEDDPAVLAGLMGADLGWAPDAAHPAPAWMVNHLCFAGGVRATLETGLLFARRPGPVDEWRQARLTVYGSEGIAEAWASGRGRVMGRDNVTREEPCDADRKLAGTIGLLAAVRDVLLDRPGAGVDLADGTDGIEGVEIMNACLASAAEAGLVRLPLDRPVAAAAPVATGSPSISVVINAADDREGGADAIASWRTNQGVDSAVQLVVTSDGSRPRLDAELRALITAADHYIVQPGSSSIGLWALGAQAATGDVLVLTESHCAAEPGCLAALLTALMDRRVHAAAGTAVPVTTNALSRLDADINARSEVLHGASTDWRLASPHALAVRRESFFAVGGYDVALDLYAEQSLVASLRRSGLPVVHAPGARVRHRFAERPAQVVSTRSGLARGQAIARRRRAPDAFERVLFPEGDLDPMEWSRRAAVGAVVGAVRAGVPLRRAGRWFWPAVLPRRALAAADGVGMAAAATRCSLWPDGDRLERAYLDLAFLAVRRARRQVLAALGPPLRSGLDGPGQWAAADLDPGRWSGAHPPDAWDGHRFVWLEPLAGLVTDLPPGRWTLCLHTGGFGRDPRAAGLRMSLDGRRLPEDAVHVGADAITVHVPARRLRPGWPQWWVLVTEPLVVPEGSDDRRLGLPVVSIEIRPA